MARPGEAATSSNGDAADPEAVAASCPTCEGIGWLRSDAPLGDPEFGTLAPCRCRIEEFDADRFARLTRHSNLGNLAGARFDDLTLPRDVVEAARGYAEKPRGWLVIVGAPGSGKTRLAAAIAGVSIERGEAVFFIPVADLLDHLRATFAPQSEITYDDLFEQVRNVPVLILDDLGYESATPWAKEKLGQLLNHRHNAAMPTVVTTDTPLDALDERLRSRLGDTSTSRVLALGGGGRRGWNQAFRRLDLALPHMTFETFKPDGGGLKGPFRDNLREALRLARSFADNPDEWLVYIGGHGSGKTHLASAIATHCRSRGDEVLFIIVPQLLDYLRSTFTQEGNPSYEVFEQVKNARVLVLDDFSETIGTAWTREKLDLLLNHRYLKRLPTVITSSLSPDEMEPRIWSRMSDPRLSNVYEIMAPDYRTGREYPTKADPDPEAERPRGRPRGRGRSA